MKKKFLSFAVIAATLFAGTCFTSCDDDDDNTGGNPDGNAVIAIDNVATIRDFVQSGTFEGQGANGAIEPGQSVTVRFYAAKGQRLMFATKYQNSNDLFFAPNNPGIDLFDSDGQPNTGPISDQVQIWDNGTRINQAPGEVIEHPGVAEAMDITEVPGRDQQNNEYPSAEQMITAELNYVSATSQFTLTLTNISQNTTHTTALSSGVWAVSNILDGDLVAEYPFFRGGERASAQMTALAENGDPAPLAENVAARTGIVTELSPVIVVVYSGTTNPLYTLNEKDGGIGLRNLAQTGDPATLKDALERLRYVDQVYILGTDPANPGEGFEGAFVAREGFNITFATMFTHSNDWFYSTNTTVSSTLKGNITGNVALLDNGTGVNQFPGAGNAQHVFDGTPATESNPIVAVDRSVYDVPANDQIIRVILR